MMVTREMICIGCPLGCPLEVLIAESGSKKLSEEDITVQGNTCKNGEIYAKKEVLHPERMVTSTVKVEGGNYPKVSVKTRTSIPKESIFAVMEEIKHAKCKAPVSIGDVVLENCAGTGVDIVATANC